MGAEARHAPRELKQHCALDETTNELLKNAMAEYNMSARAYDRILKVSRTIADLAASDRITADHVSEAIQPEFRSGLACGPGQVVAQTGSLRCRGLAARLRPGTFSNRCSPQPAPPIANRQTRQTASLRYFVAAQFRSSGSIAFAGTGSWGLNAQVKRQMFLRQSRRVYPCQRDCCLICFSAAKSGERL